MIINTITRRKDFSMVSQSDLDNLREFLTQITPYPWTPKQARECKTQADLIFISKSPEVVEFLLDYINWLKEKINLEGLKEHEEVDSE